MLSINTPRLLVAGFSNLCIILSALLLSSDVSSGAAKESGDGKDFLASLNWTKGPSTATMKSIAEIGVPKDFMFTDGDGTRKLMEAVGNLTSGSEVGLLAPTSMVWFVVFRFSDDGYVKDDEKDKLDAGKMLTSIKKGTERGNEERKRRGWPTMNIVGWDLKPAYDPSTHNLEWAIRGESQGEQIVNHNTRILGRKGVMEVKLVVDPDKYEAVLPEFKELLTTYNYKAGERYAEYRPGDKLAKYGLAALVTGGAVAVAAKTGLLTTIALFFKKGAKLIVVAVVAVIAALKRFLFGRSAPEKAAE
jgi:uncharacterized membrane-anchored protein